jgi:hypothetical protein
VTGGEALPGGPRVPTKPGMPGGPDGPTGLVPSGKGHGAAVPQWNAPEAGKLRLALEVLWDELFDGRLTDAALGMLTELHQQVTAAEEEQLAASGLTSQYLVIRPVDVLNPPGPTEMAKITEAIRTLAGLGMLAGPGGDE